MGPLLVLIIALVLTEPASAAGRPVWIDADPSCDLGMTHDVDDCWAIVAAVRSAELRVLGISTVFGNVKIEQATATTRALLQAITVYEPNRTKPPLYEGSGGPLRQAAGESSAVAQLAAALTKNSLRILALGPLTNIALLLERHPELIDQIEAIVAVAGHRSGQTFRVGTTPILHFHDLNVRKDPDAFEAVLLSGIPLHLIPFEVGRQVVVTEAHLQTLRDHGALDAWLASRSGAWLDFWRIAFGAQGFSPFDTLAVAYITNPDFFTCGSVAAKVIRRHGLFTERDTLEVSSSSETGHGVRFCSEVSRSVRESPLRLFGQPSKISGVDQ